MTYIIIAHTYEQSDCKHNLNNNNNWHNFTDIKWTPLCAEDLDVVIHTYDMWFKINATNMNNIADNN